MLDKEEPEKLYVDLKMASFIRSVHHDTKQPVFLKVEVHARTGNVMKIEQKEDFDFDWPNMHAKKVCRLEKLLH